MALGDRRRADIYKWIKIGGLLSFLPFVLVSGPLVAYLLGNYLEKRFGLPSYISLVFITIGFIVSVMETVKIIRFALRTEKEL